MGGIDSRKMAGLMNRKNAADQASKGEGSPFKGQVEPVRFSDKRRPFLLLTGYSAYIFI